MNQLEERNISCPYCGEIIGILIDCSVEQQSYVEDCQVCCQPIVFDIAIGQGDNIYCEAKREDE